MPYTGAPLRHNNGRGGIKGNFSPQLERSLPSRRKIGEARIYCHKFISVFLAKILVISEKEAFMAPRRVRRGPVLWLGLVVFLLLIIPLQVQADSNEGGLTGIVEAFKVVKGENGSERLLPADKAQPKDIIEYKLIYKNDCSTPLKNITITDPIPVGTVYLSKSASKPAAGEVQFSIDGGKEYKPWPILVLKKTGNGEEELTEAEPEMVTHIRWLVDSTIEPDREIVISYRACIK
jgi:uncharacterized repeat protein (TIGR01451 family)